MSQAFGSKAAEELVSNWESFWIQNCCVVAALALILYNHVSTFTSEVELMWRRSLNSVTLIFHLNRWVTLMWGMVTLMYYNFLPLHVAVSVCLTTASWHAGPLTQSSHSCIAVNSFRVAIILLLLSIWAGFSSIRIYAVSGGSWLLACTVWMLSMVPVGTNAYLLLTTLGWQVDISGLGAQCVDPSRVTQAMDTKFVLGTRICLIGSDLILLSITWARTYATKRQADEVRMATPVTTLLLRDGTIYFLGLLCLNVVNMVGLSTNVFAYAGGFTFPLSSIIISHFLLKLRHVVGDRSHETSESQSQPSTVRFASFVDNMGELLDYGFERPDAYGDDMIEDPGAFGSFDLPDPYKEPEVKDDSASIMLVTASENIDTDAIVSLERGVASTCDCGAAM